MFWRRVDVLTFLPPGLLMHKTQAPPEPAPESTKRVPRASGATQKSGSTPPPAGATAAPALHQGRPDYATYRYGYPPFSGRMFGSGN